MIKTILCRETKDEMIIVVYDTRQMIVQNKKTGSIEQKEISQMLADKIMDEATYGKSSFDSWQKSFYDDKKSPFAGLNE